MDDFNLDALLSSQSAFLSSQPPQVDEHTIFVKNITGATKEEIMTLFAACEPLSIIPKGNYAFVEFKNEKMKNLALKLNGAVLKGKRVLVGNKIVEKKKYGAVKNKNE